MQFALDGPEFAPLGFLKSCLDNELVAYLQAAPFVLYGRGMIDRTVLRQLPADRSRAGFTMVELALVLTMIAIMTAMSIPSIGRVLRANRVNGTAATVAADLEQAFTIAARFRRPMRISCTCGSGIYTIADRAGGTVRLRRALVGDRDMGDMTLVFNPPIAGIVDVFPSGVSTTPLTVRITQGASTRAVTLSTAGQVRIIP